MKMIKNTMLALAMSLSLGSAVYASCMGPFCWDDKGAYINGRVQDGAGDGMLSLTLAQMTATTPTAVGQVIYVSDATTSRICVSSGTTRGGYVVGVATGPFAGASYPHCS